MDAESIQSMLHRHFQVQVVKAHTRDEAMAKLAAESFQLVLVNRIFDADGDSGLDWLGELKSHPQFKSIPAMLVSNYPESQTQAVNLGALPGFGKAALEAPATQAALAAVLPARS